MLRGIGRYVHQHHVALLALFVALGGTALALDRNEVKSKHIAPGNVKLSDTNDKLRLKCGPGTRYFEGACIETASRADDDWFAAEADCVADQRRLPSPQELANFRLEPGTGVARTNYEWTGFRWSDSGADYAIAVASDGTLRAQGIAINLPYRCVAGAKR